ncbi:hypothetical protein [Azospirillum sp. Sh1]|uniref:hypothetical protein n=1 Tax=Azospirillum sp. Sh1 TaxID=2607285 RepID=UPI0020005623|nr:hypothetical protein [Azospirillum sp. Sh1]
MTGAALAAGWTVMATAQTLPPPLQSAGLTVPAPPKPKAPARQTPAGQTPAGQTPAGQTPTGQAPAGRPADAPGTCADHEPAGQAVLDALSGGDEAFAELARRSPADAFRCSSLFPGEAALAALRGAAALAPFDAVGAADQMIGRPGGAEIVALALDLGPLSRALDTGLPFYETRHELRKRLGKPELRALESQASKALAASLARDPAAMAPKIGALLDDMVDDPPADRFRIAMALSAEDLLGLIARIGPQLYTSSLDGLVNILQIQLKQERRSLLDLARGERTRPLWADFFVATVGGGRAASLFGTNPATARELMRESLRALLPAQDAPVPGADAAMVIGALADAMDLDNRAVRAALEDELAAWYRGTGETPARTMAGLAGSLHAMRLSGHPATPAFEAERFLQRHPPAALPVLTGQRLFRNGINVQRMTFYDDPDGRASFRGFLRQHRAQGWALHSQSGFTVAVSPDRHGRRIVIVADEPGAHDAGRAAAWDWMAREGLTPSIVIHRGHSYHEDSTMTEIAPATALVFWGSCGGHTRLRATLERAPDALVLATQNIGVSTVNEALLGIIENRLLADGAIDWNGVWREAQGRIRDRRFASYKRPDQDSANLAFRAWQVRAAAP